MLLLQACGHGWHLLTGNCQTAVHHAAGPAGSAGAIRPPIQLTSLAIASKTLQLKPDCQGLAWARMKCNRLLAVSFTLQAPSSKLCSYGDSPS